MKKSNNSTRKTRMDFIIKILYSFIAIAAGFIVLINQCEAPDTLTVDDITYMLFLSLVASFFVCVSFLAIKYVFCELRCLKDNQPADNDIFELDIQYELLIKGTKHLFIFSIIMYVYYVVYAIIANRFNLEHYLANISTIDKTLVIKFISAFVSSVILCIVKKEWVLDLFVKFSFKNEKSQTISEELLEQFKLMPQKFLSISRTFLFNTNVILWCSTLSTLLYKFILQGE